MLGDKRVPRGFHCQEPGQGHQQEGVKKVSRRCKEGQGVKRVSRGCQEGVKNVSGENQEGAKNMSV